MEATSGPPSVVDFDPGMWGVPPFRHQLEAWEHSKDRDAYALFWEQGVGKTCPIVATAAHLWAKGEVDGLLVVAPNGVHRNWITEEIPRHLVGDVPRDVLSYQTDKAATKAHRLAAMPLTRKGTGRLGVLAMSYEAFRTDAGKALAKEFLTTRRCLMVLDEAHRIKTPDAKTTKMIIAAGKYAPYRRILTGTPIANTPFDIYAPVRFLYPDFWKERGIPSYLVFKHAYGVFKDSYGVGGRKFQEHVGYQPHAMDELREVLRTVGARLTKEEAGLNLPPKTYRRVGFEMTTAQARVYRDIRDECLAILDSGERVDAALALVQLTRLQQVACGFVGVNDDRGKREVDIGDECARLKLAGEILEDAGKVIVWARFTRDVDKLCALMGDAAVRYDGQVADDDRARALDAFRGTDKVRAIIAKASSMGTGVTLVESKTNLYYSNTFSLVHRLQSEDRNHRIGQHDPVENVDLYAENTVDVKILEALRSKNDVASAINGDTLRAWL